MPATAAATLAVDIGGANTKAAWLDGESLRTVSRPFEVWRDREALATVLREVAAEVAAGPAHAVAITMTAELSDAFRTKREGVAFVLDAAQDALGDRPLSVLTTAGELVSVGTARARPWDVAAANWVATALAVAEAYPDALLVDIGSTTADIVPVARGRVAATAHNDLERLLAGELVYTGVLRTNLAAIAPRVPVPGGWCPVSSEYFAISADVHLVLGHLPTDAYDCPTPDGRPATVEAARERIARLVCSDVEQLDEAGIDAIAAFLHGEQVRQLEDAARRVERVVSRDAPVVAVGSGAFLGREVAARLRRAVADAPTPWGATGGEVAPAAALAALLAARLRAPC
jgi:(4-(4-[2-(gamma-L-glutamylamino)ethyl]phenoxymethyl)furan-2-yl)methanamine synthase